MAIAEEVKRQAMAHESVGFSLDLDGRGVPCACHRSTARGPRSAEAPGRHPGRGIRGQRPADRSGSARAIALDRLCGPADLFARQRRPSISVRQRSARCATGCCRAPCAPPTPTFWRRDRHPTAALFVTLAPEMVDVNVHPAKAEVRFRDPALVRGLIIGALRHALAGAGHRASTTTAADGFETAFEPAPSMPPQGYVATNARGFSGWAMRSGRSPRVRPPNSCRGVSRNLGPVRAGRLCAVRPGFRRWRRYQRRGHRPHRLPPRRGAGSGARDLYRRPDSRRRGHRRPACGA